MSTPAVLWNIFLGAMGLAYITYGKTHRKAIPLLGGIVLILVPYFIDTTYLLIGVMLFVMASSYFINI